MTAWQRRLPLALIACSLLALVAVSAAMGTPAALPSPTAQPSAAPSLAANSDPTPRIAIVYDAGGPDSAAVAKLAADGAKRAADAFSADFKAIASDANATEADREATLVQLADDGYAPIFAIGSTYARPVTNVAAKYPAVWFGIVDDASVNAPNVIGILFNEEQGSFLAGAAAALTSKTGKLGFIGAAEVPPVQKLEAGFSAGARAARAGVRIQIAYLSQPGDAASTTPAQAKKAALAMYKAGADVIYAAAGDASIGVFQAARDRHLWAIGAETDQYAASDPAVRSAILTSMLKRVDMGVYTIAMEIATGIPKDGNNVFGIGRDGLGYATSGGFVDPIKAQLDAFAAKIGAGEILVPTTP